MDINSKDIYDRLLIEIHRATSTVGHNKYGFRVLEHQREGNGSTQFTSMSVFESKFGLYLGLGGIRRNPVPTRTVFESFDVAESSCKFDD